MSCPCCGGQPLRHISAKGLYWYCLNCRQIVPNVSNTTEDTTTKSELGL